MTLRERQGKLIEASKAESDQVVVTKLFIGIIERGAMELPQVLWGKVKTRHAMSQAITAYYNARRDELFGEPR